MRYLLICSILILYLPLTAQLVERPQGWILTDNWPFGSPKEMLDSATHLIIEYQKTKDIKCYYRAQRWYELLDIRNDSIPLVNYRYEDIPDTITFYKPRRDTFFAKGQSLVLSTSETVTYELYRLTPDTIGWTINLYAATTSSPGPTGTTGVREKGRLLGKGLFSPRGRNKDISYTTSQKRGGMDYTHKGRRSRSRDPFQKHDSFPLSKLFT